MKLRLFMILLLVPFLGSFATSLRAQRIYDKDKDDLAQQASKLAGEITSSSVFDKQLGNLKLITQQDFATYFMSAKREMILNVNSFIEWSDVTAAVESVRNNVGQHSPYDGKSRDEVLADLKKKRDDAAAKLKELQQKIKAPDDPEVPVLFQRLGEVQSLFGLASDLLERKTKGKDSSDGEKTLLAGIAKIGRTLDALKDLYSSYLAKMDEIDQKSRDLEALKIPMQKVALALLQVEEAHWKTVGAIEARRAADEADVLLLLKDFDQSIKNAGINPTDTVKKKPIEDTIADLVSAAEDTQTLIDHDRENLRKTQLKIEEASASLAVTQGALDKARGSANKKEISRRENEVSVAKGQVSENQATAQHLRDSIASRRRDLAKTRTSLARILDILHIATALSAHGATPANLESLRLAQEEHRYSIRKSTVLAQAYEVTVNTGTQRLALYYKGGLKPERIAQLVHAAATAAIPIAIWTK